MPKVEKTDAEWRSRADARAVPSPSRRPERSGRSAGSTTTSFDDGVYRCAGCGAELFRSETKYDSGCGWPAFYAPAGDEAVDEEVDASHGMVRTEVLCSNCGGHLGHVFPDGPHPTGLRYCINSAALKLEEE